MSVNAKASERGRIFYGWWIVVASTIVQVLNGGIYFYGFSNFYMPLLREFGWSSTALSGAISLSKLESGVIGPFVGLLIDRIGPRIIMAVGFLTVGSGFILLSHVDSIVMLYLVFVLLLSVGSSFAFSSPTNATIAKWFVRRRGFALGIVMCGVGIGGLILPLLAWSINNYGWRTAAVWSGVLFLVAAVPLSLMMRHRPELYGCLPDGDLPSKAEAENPGRSEPETRGESKLAPTAQIRPTAADEVNFTPRQAMSTRAFWLVALVFTCRQSVTTGVGVHEIPALLNIGFSPEAAASVLTAMTLISIPGRLGFGWLADRYDKRHILGVCLVLQLFGFLAFAYATDLVGVIIFLILYSPPYGGIVPLVPATWGDYFGRNSFATIAGLAQVVTMWGTITGPLLAGYSYDVSGNYQFAFQFFAALNVLSVVLLFFVRRPKLKPLIGSVAVAAANSTS